MATLTNLVVRITGNTANLNEAVDKAQTRLDKFKRGAGNALGAVGKAAGVLSVAGGAAILGFGAAAAGSFADAGDELDKMSARTGFAVESLSELKFAAEQSGSSIETVEKGSKRLSSTILDAQNGLASATDALDALGVSVSDLDGLNPEQQFQVFATALAGVEDASTRAALAQDVFGRAGTELLPLFQQGEEGMAALRDQAVELGAVMSGDAAKSAADFKDAQNELMTALGGVFISIGQSLLPILSELVRALGPVLTNFGELAAQVLPDVFKIVEALAPVFIELLNTVLPFVPLFADLAVTVVAALLPALEELIPAFLEIVEALKPILPLLVELIAALLPPLVELFLLAAQVLTPLILLIAKGLTAALRVRDSPHRQPDRRVRRDDRLTADRRHGLGGRVVRHRRRLQHHIGAALERFRRRIGVGERCLEHDMGRD